MGFPRQEYWSQLPFPSSLWEFSIPFMVGLGFPDGASGKEPDCQSRRHKRCGFNPWLRLGRSPEGEHGNTPQQSCLRIAWAEEPGRLGPIGSQRIRHNRSDLACTHAIVSLVATSSLCFVLQESLYPSFVCREQPTGYKIIDQRLLSFCISNMSSHSLLVWKVSVEKSTYGLTAVALYVITL